MPLREKPYFWMSAAVLLCLSVFMSVLAPIPLAMCFVINGRTWGWVSGLAGLIIVSLVSKFFFDGYAFAAVFAVSLCFGAITSEIILRKWTPMRGVLIGGMSLFLFISLGIFGIVKTLPISLNEYMQKNIQMVATEVKKHQGEYLAQGGSEARQLIEMLERPDKMAQEVIETLPSTVFISVFFGIWINLFLLLRNRAVYRGRGIDYPYSEKQLLEFKMPEYFIWPLLVMLGVFVFPPSFLGHLGQVISLTAMKCMGLFYFFQGLGVYVNFLDFIKVAGVLRSFLVMFTVISGAWFVALIGLLDLWVNFRKFFKLKDNKSGGIE